MGEQSGKRRIDDFPDVGSALIFPLASGFSLGNLLATQNVSPLT
jgi:hypothetical protein